MVKHEGLALKDLRTNVTENGIWVNIRFFQRKTPAMGLFFSTVGGL